MPGSPFSPLQVGTIRATRAGRRRWIGRTALLAGLVAVAASAWSASRFDPFGRAQADFERHRYASALEAARGHLRWFPRDRAASLMAARCLTRMGHTAEAEDYYRLAGPLEPNDLHALALGLVQRNDPEGAARVYDDILRRRPDDPLALKRLAAVRMGRKEWKDVLPLGERLRAIPSEEVAGQTLLAIAHHEAKHYARAVEAARRVVALDPDLRSMPLPKTLFWNNLALDLLGLGRPEEARADLERALADVEDAGLMELLGLTYSHQGLMEQAERCWRRAESWDPNNADVCLDLGRLALSRRNARAAVDYFRRAADRSRDAVEPYYNLSQAYRMLGDLDEAVRYSKLADERRKALPPRNVGMGGDAEMSR